MNNSMAYSHFPFERVVLAGLAGGAAEVAWVSLFSTLTPVSGIEVARQVTASVMPAVAGFALAPVLGIVIHFVLSLALACAFAGTLRLSFLHGPDRTEIMAGAVMLLCTVWFVNFFVVLPVLNPSFIDLMPYEVTFVSKILFGVAMASVLVGSFDSRARGGTALGAHFAFCRSPLNERSIW